MIKTLKLTKFRQHADRTFNFTEGLNSLRSPNEGGKSTVIEAVLYALYGAKTLRDSLSQCVTWGHKEGELKVELVIEFGGEDYTYKRSKAGAEVIKNGKVFVTGQNEVSAFTAQLLGADAKTASSLMLADQSGLRGVLEDGPTAVSGLMAKLADFALIDDIIEAMQSSMLLGSDTPIRDKLRQAEETLAEVVASMPGEVEITKAEEEVELAHKFLKKWQKQRDEVEYPAYTLASEKLAEAEAAFRVRADAVAAVNDAQDRINETTDSLNTAKRKIVAVDTGRIAALRREIYDNSEALRWREAHKLYLDLPEFPEKYWDGHRQGFEVELSAKRKELEDAKESFASLTGNVRDLEKQKIVSGICKVCGTDVSARQDVVEKNARLNAEVAALEESKDKQWVVVANLTEAVANLEQVAREERKYMAAVSLPALIPYVRFDESTYPARIKWVAKIPANKYHDDSALKAELAALEKAAEDSNRAEGEVFALEQVLDQARKTYTLASNTLRGLPEIDLAPFNDAFDAAHNALSAVDDKLLKAEDWYNQCKEPLDNLVALREALLIKVEAAREKVKEYTSDIETIGFNNALLKKMKGIKPAVTDHLWNSVLAAVSQFFTQLRGEASVVTKDSDGFKVNGSTVKSLSGSTLDVLALAVRVALTKTFVPNTALLILDEPGAGCDRERMASLLGFLASVGFKQVLLASHDELSESVSDNVITLGDR